MKKRLAAFLLAAIIASATLAGCTSDDSGKTSSTTPSSTDATTSSVADDPNLSDFDKIQPVTDKPVTYKIVATMQPAQTDFASMQFFMDLEAKTNVKIDWECYQVLSYNDQKNLMLSTNQIPDAFFGYTSLTMDDVNKYGPMGMFAPIDDLVAQNSPNYAKRLEENKVLSGMSTAFDGKRYSYGTVIENIVRDYPDNLFINKEWLDKLSLKVPTNLDEYYDVLKAFKENDPNGNGKKDEIPYTFTKFNHITGYGSLFGAYGRVDAHNGSAVTALDHFVVEDNKAVFTADKDEYKNAILGLSRFFKDGLFDQEGFVQDNAQFNAKIQSDPPIAGSFYAWDKTAAGPINQEKFIPIAPLKATATSDPALVKKRQNHISVQGTGFTITSVAKNPEILAKWVDNFYNTDVSINVHYGPDGMTELSTGKYEQTYVEIDGVRQAVATAGAPGDGAPQYISWDIYDNLLPIPEGDAAKIKVIDEFYKDAPTNLTLPNINFTADEIKLNTSVGMDIQNYVKEKQSKWLLGDADITKEWDAYLAQLQTLKLNDYVAQIQAAYARTTA